jgi:rod shape-determining protein MreB
MPSITRELGIDLGTINVVISENKQVLIQEPMYVALIPEEMKMVEWGQAAKDMIGRVPERIQIIRPMINGVIAEFEITENLLSYLIKKICGPVLIFRPRIMLTIPFGITGVEARAVHEVGIGAGSREVYLIPQPLAAAIGVDLPIASPSGNMIMCLGGGTHQAAVIAMNDIIAADTARTGGLKMDEAIITYIRKQFGIMIGQPTAEQLKIKIGAAISGESSQSMEVQGQDQVSGLPRTVSLATEDIVEALQPPLTDLVNLAKRVLEKTPPELISDIIDRGVALCGGGALLRGMDKYTRLFSGFPNNLHFRRCIQSP